MSSKNGTKDHGDAMTPDASADRPWVEEILGADGLVHDVYARNLDVGTEFRMPDHSHIAANSMFDVGGVDGDFSGRSKATMVTKNVFPLKGPGDDALDIDFDLPDLEGPDAGGLASGILPVDGQTLLRIAAFWDWFVAHEARLFEIQLDEHGAVSDDNMDQVVALAEACSLIHPDLSVEIDHSANPALRRLIVSANGITQHFPMVEEIVDRAPKMTRWMAVKYRQRQRRINPLTLNGFTMKVEDVRFGITQQHSTGAFGIVIFIPGFTEEDRKSWTHMGFIFLDQVLGEFDVATKIQNVQFVSDRSHQSMDRLTYDALPRIFDHVFTSSRH